MSVASHTDLFRTIEARVEKVDWTTGSADLDAYGWSGFQKLLTAEACADISGLYAESGKFRSQIIMAQHGFGRGEYKYFSYPLPGLVAGLRTAIYPHLAPVANPGNEARGSRVRYPDSH